MFLNSTVFLLGAGASWHYGFPTGEALVRKVADRADALRDFFENMGRQPYVVADLPLFVNEFKVTSLGTPGILQAWIDAAEKCRELAERLRATDPLVIDYFLGLNPSLQEVGKFVIALVLLECEAAYRHAGGNPNRREAIEVSPLKSQRDQVAGLHVSAFKDNWYRFILHKLITDCKIAEDLLNKEIKFVTFNYDLSLEHFLEEGLTSIDLFRNQAIIDKFFEGRVIHVYGKLRERKASRTTPVNWRQIFDTKGASDPQAGAFYANSKNAFNQAYDASKLINTIDPLNKSENMQEIEDAITAIDKASVIYILGYSFDKNNNQRLALEKSLFLLKDKKGKAVAFTNYGDSDRVNKAASRLFFKHSNRFSPGNRTVHEQKGDYYCEKSIRNVYEALELDFDSLEDLPI